MRLGRLLQKLGNVLAVMVVAAALPLRLEDVALAQLRVLRDLARLETGLGGVHREDVGESLKDSGRAGCVVGDEAAKDRGRGSPGGWSRRRQYLLDLLAAGQLGQDGGALDGRRPLEVVAGLPGALVRVVGRVVPAPQVRDGDFEHLARVPGQLVEQLALGGVGDGGVLQELGEGDAEDGDGVGGVVDEGVLEVALVKDVPLTALDDEDDALFVAEFRWAVGVVSGADATGEALDALVLGQVEGPRLDGVIQQRVLCHGKEPMCV